MSAATNWAWELPVRPMAKLVLLALAEVAPTCGGDLPQTHTRIDVSASQGALTRLVDLCGLEPTSILSVFNELQLAGLIFWDGRFVTLQLRREGKR